MHPLVSKLGLGTAQFGLDSGPVRGKPPEVEARDILALAGRAGLSVFDTCAASHHGEVLLAQAMPRPMPMRVIIKAARGERGPDFVEAEARACLRRLGLPKADAIVVQSASDLFSAQGAAAWRRLAELRDEGLFDRIGVSAYASDDPVGIARRFQPDLIQAPASLLDQRLLVDGSLESVRGMGVEVHLRSIFLNGLLFLPPDRVPSELKGAAARLSRARRLIAEGRSDPLQAALGFALSRPEADAVIVGAATVSELNAVIAAAAKPPPDLDWDDMALDDPTVLDGRRQVA
jgi:aryl-alcohol dehydrogenase-like predicted oxidoreductase